MMLSSVGFTTVFQTFSFSPKDKARWICSGTISAPARAGYGVFTLSQIAVKFFDFLVSRMEMAHDKISFLKI
jgi:hypothetical protein